MIVVPDVLEMNVRHTKTARLGSVYLIVLVMVAAYVIQAKVRIARLGRDVLPLNLPPSP